MNPAVLRPRSHAARAVALTSFAALLLLAACDRPSSAAHPAQPPPPMPVGVSALSSTEVRDSTEYIATLRSRRSITIQPQVEGHLTQILVKSGDRVRAGQPIAQIDGARQQASVVAAEASRASRQATLALAQRELERTQTLVDKGALAGSFLDQARASVDAARADVDALGAQIRANQVQLRYYRVVAPSAGVIGDVPARVGDLVSPMTVITTLDNNDALEAYVSIPVERAPRVRIGTSVELVGEDRSTVAVGEVYFVSPQVTVETQSVLVKAQFPNAGGALRSEQFVRARVIWDSKPGVVIPALSVVRLAGQPFVFAVEAAPDGKGLIAKQKPVTLGELRDNHFAVTSGLVAGDRIVTSGIQKLRDGAPIAEDKSGEKAAAAPPAGAKPADAPAEAKPAEAKPETQPAEAKPVEGKATAETK